jgi:hypothetical protein
MENMDLVRLDFAVENAVFHGRHAHTLKKLSIVTVTFSLIFAAGFPWTDLPWIAVVLGEALAVLLIVSSVQSYRRQRGRYQWSLNYLQDALDVFCRKYSGEPRPTEQEWGPVNKARTILNDKVT